MRALPVVTHSVSNPAAQLILRGQSKTGAHGDFRRNALRRACGLDEAPTPCSWARLEIHQSRATPLAELSQVEYAKTLAKVMKA